MSDMEVIKIGKREFKVLFPHLLREYQERELVALRKSIRLRGVEVAIVVDEDGGVIDGINRLRTAAELKLANVPTDVRVGLSDEQKLKLCYELNDARRHMSAADREEVKARVERINAMRAEGKTTREIAATEGISLRQVRRDLAVTDDADFGGGGVTGACAPVTPPPTPDRVIGRDGVARPAKNDADAVAQRDAVIANGLAQGKSVNKVAKDVGVTRKTVQNAKKRLAENANDDTPAPEPVKPEVILPTGESVQGKKILRDEFGIPIQDHAREAFEARERHDELIKLLKQARLLLSEIVDGPSGTHLRKMVNWSRKPTKDKPDAGIWQMAELENAITNIQITRPAMTDCPYVYSQYHTHSDECRYCYGSRWCPSIKHRTCPEEHIRAMKSHYGIASDTPEESEG